VLYYVALYAQHKLLNGQLFLQGKLKTELVTKAKPQVRLLFTHYCSHLVGYARFPAEHEHGLGNAEITITSRSLRSPVFDIRDTALPCFLFDGGDLWENLRGAAYCGSVLCSGKPREGRICWAAESGMYMPMWD
jgi:hypothetical protein